MIGKTFKHAHIESMSCTVLEETNKGYKVAQMDTKYKRGKAITQYYNRMDFIGNKAFWIEK